MKIADVLLMDGDSEYTEDATVFIHFWSTEGPFSFI